MARRARRLSPTGLYHVIFRGNGKQNIFEEKADYQKMLSLIQKIKTELKYELYAYCLMTNHVHLFLKENQVGDLPKLILKLLTQYAGWFNFKYERTGTLFEGRYKSEPVEDDAYFLSLLRYIHQNPIKAGIVEKAIEYRWSSFSDYIYNNSDLIDIEPTLALFSENQTDALKLFATFHATEDSECFEMEKSVKNSQQTIRRIIMKELGGEEPNFIKTLNKVNRNAVISVLINEKGVSASALERATGISRGTIHRILTVQK